MKGRKLIFTAVMAIAIGTTLILTYRSIRSTGVVISGGILFILAGVINTFTSLGTRDSDGRSRVSSWTMALGWITSAAAVVLGLCMLIFQSTFIGLVPFIFGVLVAFGALYQFFLLGFGARPVTLPVWLFIAPVLLTAGSIYIFMQKAGADDSSIMLLTGISFAVFGAATLIEGIIIGSRNRSMRRRSSQPDDNNVRNSDALDDVQDVDATEIRPLGSPEIPSKNTPKTT